MDYSEIEQTIRKKVNGPGATGLGGQWGWKAEAARQLGVKPQYLDQMIDGTRRIAPDHIGKLAELVGLELLVREKSV